MWIDWNFISFPLFLLFQLPLLLAAMSIEKYIGGGGFFQRINTVFLIYTIICIISGFILGMFGIASQFAVLITSLVICLLCWKHTQPDFNRYRLTACSRYELACISLAFGLILMLMYLTLPMPPVGTDALIYHLFYPASWLQQEGIFRIPMIAFHTDYYPFYGEVMYLWWMLPTGDDTFAKLLQLAFLGMSYFAICRGGEIIGVGRRATAAGALIPLFCGIIFRNAAVPNTDVITGYFLLNGVVFLLEGIKGGRRHGFVLGGMALGICASLKYNGLLLAPPLCILMLAVVALRRSAGWRLNIFLTVVSAVVMAAPCYIWNWFLTGNPLYPRDMKAGGWHLLKGVVVDPPLKATGLSGGTWNFFVNSSPEAMSFISGVLFLVLPFLFLAAAYKLRRCGRRNPEVIKMAVLVAAMVIISFILLVSFYPSFAQPRQIIPVLMLAGMMFALCLEVVKKSVQLPIAVALAIGVAFTQMAPVSALILLGVAVVLYGCIRLWGLLPALGHRIMLCLIIAGLSFCSMMLVNISLAARYETFSILLGRDSADGYNHIAQMRKTDPYAVTAYTGAQPYPLLGDNLQGKVVYVPVTSSGARFQHEYDSMSAMRQPGTFEQWLARLDAADVRYVFCHNKYIGESYNPFLEIRWALACPERFRLLIKNKELMLFELLPPGQ